MQKRLKKIQLGTEINVDIKNNIGMLDNIEGNSYQATREGYNVFDYIERILPNTYGLTMQVDRNTGYITTNGTPTKNYVSIMPSIDVTNLLENGEIYTLWQENYADKANGKIYLQIMAIPKDGGNILYYNSSTKKYNITVDKNKYNYKLGLQTGIIEEAETFNNYKNRYMIYKGTEDKEFELYGNSPSLDYPSEVEAVGDNINLINIEEGQTTLNGITFDKKSNGTIIVNGTASAVAYIVLKSFNVEDIDYSLSGCPNGGSGSTFSQYVIVPSTGAGLANDFGSGTTFRNSNNASVEVRLRIAQGYTANNLIFRPKLEKSKVVTPYSLYNQGSVEIVHNNKNFLNLPDLTYTQNGVTIEVTNGNHFKITGNQTGEINKILYDYTYFKNINNIAYNKYPVTISRSTKEYLPFELNFASDKSNWYMQIARNTTKVTKNILNEKINRLSLYIGFSSTKEINYEFDLQLEISKEVTGIIEPKENTYILPIQKPFYKIGKYTDGFVRLGNQWYEQHYIAKFDLSDSEWKNDGAASTVVTMRWASNITLNNIDSPNSRNSLSNYFSNKEAGYNADTVGYNIENNIIRIRLPRNIATTKEAVKSFWQEKAKTQLPYIYYLLSTPELVKCTEEQNSILNDLSNIQLYNGINYIYTNEELKPTLKFLYYDKYEKDDDVYVFDKDENLIAVFDKDDEDTIINPQVHDLQNTESTFSFSLPLNSAKWQQINNAENLYYTDNKMFSTNFDGCFTSDVNENNEDLVSIIAYERQKLLERMYVRAWNSEDGFENVDTFMCVILSKGNLELKNNGELVNSTHLKGTSGYVLDGLLYGTGWTTGVCDVEGEFDFETDQVDIFNNILKVQEIWGGILVIDSVNKIIEHRDETKFLPYDGFEVRYQKNMQSLEKIYNNKIITELCPLGEGGLNIKSVNGGSEWITNYTYSSSRLQGIENNADITDPVQLKKWGERKLKDLCKPSKELNVKAILLNQIEGFEHEVIGLNDIVDVIDYQFIVGDIEQLRVVEYTHKIWDNSDAEIVLSDITLDSTDIFKKTVSATDTINNGTLTTNKVVDFFKNGQSLHQTLTQIGNTIENTKTDLTKSDEEIEATVTSVRSEVDKLNHTILSQQEIIEKLEITIEGLKNQLTTSGGNNLIRNSVGIFGNEYWEGSVIGYTDTDIQQNNVSKNAIFLQNGSIMQEILRIKNGFYNISFNYKKLLEAAVCKVKINDNIEIDLDNTSWDSIDKQLEILDNYFRIEFISDSNNACYISDLILIVGKNKQTWTQNINETISETVSIGQGIRVDSDKTNTYTRIDSDGNRTFNKATNQAIMEATDKGINAENAIVRTQAEITGVLQQKVGDQVWGALL